MADTDIEELVGAIKRIPIKYNGILEKDTICDMITDYVKKDKLNILMPSNTDRYIKYWAAITYYDRTLYEALIANPQKWYQKICDEIKESLKTTELTRAVIKQYYKNYY